MSNYWVNVEYSFIKALTRITDAVDKNIGGIREFTKYIQVFPERGHIVAINNLMFGVYNCFVKSNDVPPVLIHSEKIKEALSGKSKTISIDLAGTKSEKAKVEIRAGKKEILAEGIAPEEMPGFVDYIKLVPKEISLESALLGPRVMSIIHEMMDDMKLTEKDIFFYPTGKNNPQGILMKDIFVFAMPLENSFLSKNPEDYQQVVRLYITNK